MQLIKVDTNTIGNEVKQTINARDLHAFLEVGKDFSSWIKDQIIRARLVENQDFILLTEKGEQTGRGGHNKLEYYLTIESGKSIGMMSGTDKGFEIRNYFLECEKRLLNIPAINIDPVLAQIEIIKSMREKQLALESNQNVLSSEVDKLKDNMRIENWQQCNIKKAVDQKVSEFKDLYPSVDSSALYRKIWRYIKDKFRVPRYNELPAMMYDEALKAINKMAMHNLAGF